MNNLLQPGRLRKGEQFSLPVMPPSRTSGKNDFVSPETLKINR